MQLCVPVHSQFPSLFIPYDVGKYEIRCQLVYEYYIPRLHTSLIFVILNDTQPEQSWQYWHSCIIESF